ncbi:cation:proton antiporter [Robiginitomaculum antarcticum]|uniref:cation:proton antiporter n=1 Tax=Robiginitomaculum antarcticum TaxID=437507 RepID=UPI00037B17EB|nr:cation:proton antiporter [Robiginitomaculum antarcticum]
MSDVILTNPIAFYYSLIGLAFLGLTLRPALKHSFFFNVPIIYIVIGAFAAVIGLPVINPMASGVENKIITHGAELVVIISLSAAGLAIDLTASWKNWQPTWRLLGIAMPLTIAAIAVFGIYACALPLATAILLGAAMAPTDPVLARSVQVGPPNSEQSGVTTALTSEAGLNDGLAFPFIWLAIGLATAAVGDFNWAQWASYYVLYKIAAGIIVGVAMGWLITKFLFSPLGDATNERANPALIVLGATFIAYGGAEFIHGYGFISVFIAARAARSFAKDTSAEPYENAAHESADQLEAILMAILLLWLGAFIGTYLWHQWIWSDLLVALAIVFVIRPVAGWISLIGMGCNRMARYKMMFFGIRGMGSIFYVAYALGHADFTQADTVWRICALTILVSALIHGSLANVWMQRDNEIKTA